MVYRKKADAAMADELFLYTDNDGQLYRQQKRPIEKNLCRKIKKGIYSKQKSVKLWGYLMDSAAKKYCKDMTCDRVWHQEFNKATRMKAAKMFADYFDDVKKEIC